MRFVSYVAEGGAQLGIVGPDDLVTPLEGDLASVIGRWDETSPPVACGDPVPLDGLRLLAPIPRPARNVFCVGKNYHEHAREFSASGFDASAGSGEAAPAVPVVFTKAPSAVVGPGAVIERHETVTSMLDYEAELAVIVGRGGRDLSETDAADHIWGYTIVNDVTARDRQREHKQWFLGKSLDTFCPMGPFAVTADEVDPEGAGRPDLELTCRVNGELRQKARTLDLIFDIPTIVATISAGLTLEPGDIIATGTPAGVGIGFNPPRFLAAGDEVEITITGLGTLRNTVG